ncbi:MAG TPA: 30S ribosomal protein S2 [Thermomicrobiales bacterium]|nr:30S ribosomal protein S2 [Thermomicrobiales bacterium]
MVAERVDQPLSTYGMPPREALRTLLEAGVHFGHQTKRWNPKMKPYIFTERNGIHIIDLQQTVPLLAATHRFVTDLTARGGKVLFVGTKKQAQEIVEREAQRSNQFFINQRWLGGTLTNFVTIRSRLRVLKQLQAQAERGEFDILPKQEAATKLKELERLERTLGGMRDMTQLPGAVFIVDPKREHLAVHEAKRLGIPVIAVTDTNCDPDDSDFLIPGNDDAIRAVRLLAAGIAEAAIQGQTRNEMEREERSSDSGPPAPRRGGSDGDPMTAEDFTRVPPATRARRQSSASDVPAEPPVPEENAAPEAEDADATEIESPSAAS